MTKAEFLSRLRDLIQRNRMHVSANDADLLDQLHREATKLIPEDKSEPVKSDTLQEIAETHAAKQAPLDERARKLLEEFRGKM
jgi:hypothetical protein